MSILSDEFLAEVRGMKFRNLAVELLQKLLNDAIKTRSRKNLVQSRLFSEMLQKAVVAYQTRAIESVQIIEMLIQMAKDMREAELAFYDALEVNDSAVQVLGDEVLRTIARDLVDTVKRNTGIDWSVKDSARARLRVAVKKVLRKYGYPPDKQQKALDTVLSQADVLSGEQATTLTN